MNRRVLVLGSTGFVGKATMTKLNNMNEISSIGVSRENGLDLRNLQELTQFLRENPVDVIINCAAHVGSVHYVEKYAADIISDNATMIINMYRAVAEVNKKIRVINPVSNCSYPGEKHDLIESEWMAGPVHDSVFAYGFSRRLMYVTAKSFYQQHGIHSVNWLVPNTFGPGDHCDPNKVHALNGMIIRMIKAKKEKQKTFEIWGTGKPIREWAYIDDVTNILTQSMFMENPITYPINFGQKFGISIKDSANIIKKHLNFSGDLIFNDKYKDGAPVKIMDNGEIKKKLPDYKFFDHEEGVKNTINYYMELV